MLLCCAVLCHVLMCCTLLPCGTEEILQPCLTHLRVISLVASVALRAPCRSAPRAASAWLARRFSPSTADRGDVLPGLHRQAAKDCDKATKCSGATSPACCHTDLLCMCCGAHVCVCACVWVWRAVLPGRATAHTQHSGVHLAVGGCLWKIGGLFTTK